MEIRIIRLSRATVELLRGIDHGDYADPCNGAGEADYCLDRGGPFYSSEGGSLLCGMDFIENEEPGSPILDMVIQDFKFVN